MTKQDLMNYVTETPENVNKNILSQKIDQYIEETGGGNAVQYVPQELTEEQQMQARANLTLYRKEKQLVKRSTSSMERITGGDDPYPGYYAEAIRGYDEMIVMFDDVAYRTTIKWANDFDFTAGNLALKNIGEDTGEPFLIVGGGVVSYTYAADGSTDHTIAWYTEEESFVTIPEEYIPDTIARKTDVGGFVVKGEYDYGSGEYIFDKSFIEIGEAAQSGPVTMILAKESYGDVYTLVNYVLPNNGMTDKTHQFLGASNSGVKLAILHEDGRFETTILGGN